MNENLKNAYSNKPVNPNYYKTIAINGGGEKVKELTEQEWRDGEQGIVWFDNKSGKLVFKG